MTINSAGIYGITSNIATCQRPWSECLLKGRKRERDDYRAAGERRGGGTTRHEEIVKINGVYAPSKIDARRATFTSRSAMADIVAPYPPSTLLLLRSLAARQLSLIRSRGPLGAAPPPFYPSPSPTLPLELAEKRRDTSERDGDQKKCRSIYIIINRKEIYLILRAKDSLFPSN